MIDQSYNSNGGALGVGLVALAIWITLVVLFVFMAVNVNAIRKAADIGLLGTGGAARICQFCKMSCPPAAAVCYRCGRDIGAWTWHEGLWWAQTPDGEWRWQTKFGSWMPVDAGHTPPDTRQDLGAAP